MKTKAVTAVAKGTATQVATDLTGQIAARLGDAKPVLVVAFASLDQPLSELMPALHAAYPGALVLGSQSMVSARTSPRPVRPTATTRAVPSRRTALLEEPAPIIRPSARGLMIAPASIAL